MVQERVIYVHILEIHDYGLTVQRTKPYDVMSWHYSIGGPVVQNIQEWILKLANDGENPCGLLSTDCEPNPEFSQCVQYPEANFVWFAMAAFSNYLGNMANAILNCQQILTDYTGTMVGEFFTPQTVSYVPPIGRNLV